MTGSPRQTYSIDEIKHMLVDRLDAVVAHYAPEAPGSYKHEGKYFTLNPGRVDRSVGSFCVHMRGSRAGSWNDYAIGDVPGEGFGDVLDLIALSQQCSMTDAIKEARAFLGLSSTSPDIEARRKAAIAASQRRQAAARKAEAEEAAKKARRAYGLWYGGIATLRDTPVDHYLRGRGVDLSALGRQPGVLRYVPECWYYHEDNKTGEIIEGKYPAMVAAITDRTGRMVACHRTYLELVDGQWGKARVPNPKLTLADWAGCYIPIWKGIGPRGGKPLSLHKAAPGQHVYLTEGIEDALSAVLLLGGQERVIATVNLTNRVKLPPTVSTVTIIGDADKKEEQQKARDRQIEMHRKEGRTVRLWLNRWGGKDLNDALQASREGLAAE